MSDDDKDETTSKRKRTQQVIEFILFAAIGYALMELLMYLAQR